LTRRNFIQELKTNVMRNDEIYFRRDVFARRWSAVICDTGKWSAGKQATGKKGNFIKGNVPNPIWKD
jgi:hypothetical protein